MLGVVFWLREADRDRGAEEFEGAALGGGGFGELVEGGVVAGAADAEVGIPCAGIPVYRRDTDRYRDLFVQATIIGALAALAGILMGQLLAKRSDHQRWVRERRFEACSAFMEALTKFNISFGAFDPSKGEQKQDFLDVLLQRIEQLTAATAKVWLVCPQALRMLANEATNVAISLAQRQPERDEELHERFYRLHLDFTFAAQRLLGVSPRIRQRPGEKPLDHLGSGTRG